jgi:hypothetical protein
MHTTTNHQSHFRTIQPPKTMNHTACSFDRVGEVILTGCYGGAHCWHMRCTKIERGTAFYELVIARSVRNANGTFSTVYEAA